MKLLRNLLSQETAATQNPTQNFGLTAEPAQKTGSFFKNFEAEAIVSEEMLEVKGGKFTTFLNLKSSCGNVVPQ